MIGGMRGLSFVLDGRHLDGSSAVCSRTGKGHEIAQGYGMFLWAGVVSYGGGCLAASGTRERGNGRVAAEHRSWPACRLLEGETRTNHVRTECALSGKKELSRKAAEDRLGNAACSAGIRPFNE